MDPISKVIWLLIVAVGVAIFSSFVPGAVLLAVLLLLTLVGARVPLRTLVRSAGLIGSIGLLLGIWHSFVDPGRPLYHLGPLTVTDRGVLTGLQYFFRISVVVLATLLLAWTTDINDLMVGLVHVGLPYRYAFVVFTTLRFMPIIENEVEAVRTAHAIRGRAARNRFSNRLLLWQRYLFTVLVNGLRKGEQVAVAAECRGFGALPTRTYRRRFRWTASGVGLVVVFLVAMVVLKLADQVYWTPWVTATLASV
jgi:energy-coupling factor transporter transmembrane protein EcfT